MDRAELTTFVDTTCDHCGKKRQIPAALAEYEDIVSFHCNACINGHLIIHTNKQSTPNAVDTTAPAN